MCHIVIVLVSVAVLVSVIVISFGAILFKKMKIKQLAFFPKKQQY